jgi:hypothetical protein
MLADFNLVGINREQLGQHRDFNLQAGQVVRSKRGKSCIAECGALGAMSNAFKQSVATFDKADAAAKVSVNVDSHKNAAS